MDLFKPYNTIWISVYNHVMEQILSEEVENNELSSVQVLQKQFSAKREDILFAFNFLKLSGLVQVDDKQNIILKKPVNETAEECYKNSIFVLCRPINNAIAFYEGIHKILSPLEKEVKIILSPYKELDLIQPVFKKIINHCEGFILFYDNQTSGELTELLEKKAPKACLLGPLYHEHCDTVFFDYQAGMRQLFQTLIEEKYDQAIYCHNGMIPKNNHVFQKRHMHFSIYERNFPLVDSDTYAWVEPGKYEPDFEDFLSFVQIEKEKTLFLFDAPNFIEQLFLYLEKNNKKIIPHLHLTYMGHPEYFRGNPKELKITKLIHSHINEDWSIAGELCAGKIIHRLRHSKLPPTSHKIPANLHFNLYRT